MAQPTLFTQVMRSGRKQFGGLFFLSFLSNILLLASSIYMLQVFDRVLASGSYDTLIWLSVLAVLAIVAYGFLEFARRKVLTRTGAWIASELSPEVIRRTIAARLSTGRSPAGLGDVRDVRGFVGGDAILAFFDAPWSPVFIAIIWFMHPLLGMIAVAGAVTLFAIGVLNDVITRRSQAQSAMQMRQVHNDADAFVANAEALEGMGMIGSVVTRWRTNHENAEQEGASAAEVSAILFNLSRSIRLGLQIAILGAGAALVLQAELSAGGMIAASIILARALSPVERAISAWKSFGSYRLARSRLARLFKETATPKERISLAKPAGNLAVKDVRYFAPETRAPLVKSVSFQLRPGELCGMLGPSGSGKSSLCRLLVGAWRPSFGEIRLDGAELAEWDSEERGRFIGYLPQQTELFSGTVAENIARMGAVNDDAVLNAAKKAGAHEMILALPEGYETQLGQFRDQLSGGQKQRIGLARALYGDPSFVVLDEPNSNLDGNGEIALQRALSAMKAVGQTVLIVTHVPNLLRQVDKILVIHDGTLKSFGNRDEVMREMMPKGRAAPKPAQAAE
ncbi:ATP-binding cassette, subfamily C/ATP-binding cassette, subfamily C, exporter for protease/lipase [Shimia gijangensis]|uniref:ATP-binding cassette, subfamily C/ATP-binding cassette, subfamily C, exporter for protease/lipase n=1 Tax=Shimia gijangensis TaxID=1470563 RepID=A0A1M6QXA4_9RHOB|nr:type I secretion system permease/ATPase [Shimia gijangensis]SHK24753.1 ATP-binding cassette, subfamily C/ATP-binding cassette, subfamily C, exporter for protease/lipase [Shimia gijangensis]